MNWKNNFNLYYNYKIKNLQLDLNNWLKKKKKQKK